MTRRTAIYSMLLLFAAAGVGFWFFKMKSQSREEGISQVQPATVPAPPAEVQQPQTIIDYAGIEKDKDLKTLMEERKSEYGVDKSVDMIVTPDESLLIGGVTVPMQEILDRIRIRKGEGITEKELAGGSMELRIDRDRLRIDLKNAEDRLKELEAWLIHPESIHDKEVYPKYAREYIGLLKLIRKNEEYRNVEQRIAENGELLKFSDADLRKKLMDDANALHIEKDRIENSLKERLMPEGTPQQLAEKLKQAEDRLTELENLFSDPNMIQNPDRWQQYLKEYLEVKPVITDFRQAKQLYHRMEEYRALVKEEGPSLKMKLLETNTALTKRKNALEIELAAKVKPKNRVEVYGIYVVQPGDNVWNIHFNFLKEYFEKQGVAVSPRADEPIGGQSSGVGKILKFSENMVYIYNLKERNLSVDLNLIEPLTKIVVFNLSQALSVLEQIDYKTIQNIRFDGERIWIPAAQ